MAERLKVRAFLAIPPDSGWTAAAAAALARIRPELPDASWTRPEAWHLTLRFLGDVEPARLDRFAGRIGVAAAESGAPVLESAGAAVFPTPRRARVLGVAFHEGSGALESLASSAETAARAIGLDEEERAFRPHATLARLRHPWPAAAVERFRAAVGGWELPLWRVGELVLYASALGPGGAVHTPLARFALAPAAEAAR